MSAKDAVIAAVGQDPPGIVIVGVIEPPATIPFQSMATESGATESIGGSPTATVLPV